MTPAAAIELVDATWYSEASICRDCHHHRCGVESVGPWWAPQGTPDYAHRCRVLAEERDPFDCPAVEAEQDKECEHEHAA